VRDGHGLRLDERRRERVADAEPAAARSIAAHATRAPSPAGTPGGAENSSPPTAIFSAGVVSVASQVAGRSTATSPASSACAVSQAAMISGPTPAGSPHVKANLLGIVVLRAARPTCPGKAALAAGEKLEEQIDNLCPSLSWTQRMIGFGITAGEYFFPRSSTLFELDLASLQVVLQVSVFSSLLLASFSSAS
jgi:hypothetical protein